MKSQTDRSPIKIVLAVVDNRHTVRFKRFGLGKKQSNLSTYFNKLCSIKSAIFLNLQLTCVWAITSFLMLANEYKACK